MKLKYNIAGISKIILLTKELCASSTYGVIRKSCQYGCYERLEAATASNILICDYLVYQGKVRKFLNLSNCGKHSHDQGKGKR